MSSNDETRRKRQNRKHEPDLSAQYREIGIKAVAAAARNGVKGQDVTGDPERRKREKEKARG